MKKPQPPTTKDAKDKPKVEMTMAQKKIYSISLGFQINQPEDLEKPKR